MRISDWSSDVCSSDLELEPEACIPFARTVVGAEDRPGRDIGTARCDIAVLGQVGAPEGQRPAAFRLAITDAGVDLIAGRALQQEGPTGVVPCAAGVAPVAQEHQ